MSQDREPFYSSPVQDSYFKDVVPWASSSSLVQQGTGGGAVYIQGALAHDLKWLQVCGQLSGRKLAVIQGGRSLVGEANTEGKLGKWYLSSNMLHRFSPLCFGELRNPFFL